MQKWGKNIHDVSNFDRKRAIAIRQPSILPPNLEIEYQPIGFQSIHRFASLLPRYLERSYSVANQEGEFDVRSRIRGGEIARQTSSRVSHADDPTCTQRGFVPLRASSSPFYHSLPFPRSLCKRFPFGIRIGESRIFSTRRAFHFQKEFFCLW